ncbi:MAG TPA: VOC family protein, partial [Acidobacteriaceae bacterium]|nr:VOC family protein [Acidobacteriaceae bacterium]
MMTYGQQPNCAEADKNRVMHANISAPDGSAVMASDAPAAKPIPEGGNFNISIACDSAEEQDRIFNALSEGGHVHQPLQNTFWGARFGMLRDKFGVGWMLSHHSRPQA